jgi:hypothetical protein
MKRSESDSKGPLIISFRLQPMKVRPETISELFAANYLIAASLIVTGRAAIAVLAIKRLKSPLIIAFDSAITMYSN